jgi:hypothetical protein
MPAFPQRGDVICRGRVILIFSIIVLMPDLHIPQIKDRRSLRFPNDFLAIPLRFPNGFRHYGRFS